MSDKDSSKSLTRPKVRFSQTSLEIPNENAARPFHRPVIRDIITLKKPVIIVRSQDDKKDDQISKSDENSKVNTTTKKLAENSVNIIDQLEQQTQNLKISSNKPIINLKNKKSTDSASSKSSSSKSSKSGQKPSVTFAEQNPTIVDNVLQNRGQTENNENISKPQSTIEIPLLLIDDEITSSEKSKQSENQSKTHHQSRVNCSENKENIVKKSSSNRSTKLAPSKSESAKLIKTNPKSSTATSTLTQSKPQKKCLPCLKKPVTISCREPKIPVAGTMACLKARKKCDKPIIKKDIVRNKAGPLPNIYVGPGTSQIKSPTNVIDVYKKPDVLSSNKLIKPEFNSIVGTMRKLQEIKKKKVANDIDSLPDTYKNLIMGKMSSALDFPASEQVFRDLVDISINENQLPTRITRSKDPEPRQKDLVPNLSDFFNPKYCKEYSEASQIRPRTPEVFDNWSAFTISDRINSWKNRLDNN